MKLLSLGLLLCLLASPALGQEYDLDEAKAINVLSYLVGGEAPARAQLGDLRRIANAQPYSLLITVGVFRQLLVWGWNPDEAKDIIKGCANAAVAVGGDDDRFAKITLTLGRMTDSEESVYVSLSSLENDAIPAWQFAGKKLGRSSEQVKALALRHELRPKPMVRLVIEAFNQAYAGAADQAARQLKEAMRAQYAKGLQEALRNNRCNDCSVYAAGETLVIVETRTDPNVAAQVFFQVPDVMAGLKKCAFTAVRFQQSTAPNAKQVQRSLSDDLPSSAPPSQPASPAKKLCAQNGVRVPCP